MVAVLEFYGFHRRMLASTLTVIQFIFIANTRFIYDSHHFLKIYRYSLRSFVFCGSLCFLCNLVRKLHDSRSQAVCKPSTVSTVQNNQLACHDVDGLYHTALADEEHPPGAPKRPAVNVKTVKSSTPHPM